MIDYLCLWVDLLLSVFFRVDVLSYSVVVVSLFVKIECDWLMCELDVEFFGYGFVVYKGYGVFVYCVVLCELGVIE